MNVAEYLLGVGEGQDPAIVEPVGTTTYTQLRGMVARTAAALNERGLVRGQRVGLMGANTPGWVAGYLATMGQGLVAVPMPAVWTPEEVAQAVEWVDARILVADGATRSQVPSRFRDRLLDLPGATIEEGQPSVPVDLDDDAALMFTSGTTGRPRVVRVTHRNLIANTESILGYLRLSSDDRMLVILPFSYCYGASLLHTHLRVGGAVSLCNSFVFPEVAVGMMADQQCTGFAGVPSSYQLLLRASTFSERELPALRRMLQAGGKMHDATIEAVLRAQPEADLYVMYGQTEATARLSYLPPEYLASKLGSIGRGIPGVELRVVDDAGRPVEPGQVGEIHATGDNISPGYLNDPEATAQRFEGRTLHTGDMARVDEDGFIFVVGRTSDFIKTWGYRVSALEVEASLMQIPGIAGAAVFGVADDAAGEAIAAALLMDRDAEITPSAVREHCRRTLPRHLTPKHLHVVPEFPLNAAGKVDKAALAATLHPETS